MIRQVENNILLPEIIAFLHEGKEVRFTPTGFSMRPFIEGERDTVVLRYIPTVRVGDIVLASPSHPLNHKYVLHRVISVTDEYVTLQGDGNLSGTEQCSIEDIYGTVVLILDGNGRPKRLTRGRLWFYLRPCRRLLLKIYRKLCSA